MNTQNVLLDMNPRYAPTAVMVYQNGVGHIMEVEEYKAHPPGTHPYSPIRNDQTALELITKRGSRWYGVTKAWINSELRMVIQGTNRRDETRMNWELCTTP